MNLPKPTYTSIIVDDLRFKIKLDIGEDAYTSLKLKNNLLKCWDSIGVAATGVGIAKTSVVASTFFAPSGLLGVLGLGTAVTPIGWVIAAGVVSSGAWYGLNKFFDKDRRGKVTVIPEFINTPIDIIGLAIFNVLAPLAVKLSKIDGEIHPKEITNIKSYFIEGWGYSKEFIDFEIGVLQNNIDQYSISGLAVSFAKLSLQNPDCNYDSMTKEVLKFLNSIMESDGVIDEREEMMIEKVKLIFKEEDEISLKNAKKKVADALSTISSKSFF